MSAPATSTVHEDSRIEEIASAIVHGVGAGLALVGLVLLVVFASLHGGALQIVTVSVFGACMVAVYLASTLLHAVTHRGLQKVFLECDHLSIYLLIAGTYTPLMLVALGGGWGWAVFGVIWGLAAAGITMRMVLRDRRPLLSTAMYVATGWAGLIAVVPMVQTLSTAGLLLILAGGVSYTGGVTFFLWRRLRFSHAIWHAFVVAGSIFHFAAVWVEVIRPVAAA